MIIEKIHKKCGGNIISSTLCSYPPIYVEKCQKCGEEISRTREEIKRIEVD